MARRRHRWQREISADLSKHLSTRCATCGAYRPMGRSNDRPVAVRVEIRAAHLATLDVTMTLEESLGWSDHTAGVQPMDEGRCGWLARQIAFHDDELAAASGADAPEAVFQDRTPETIP